MSVWIIFNFQRIANRWVEFDFFLDININFGYFVAIPKFLTNVFFKIPNHYVCDELIRNLICSKSNRIQICSLFKSIRIINIQLFTQNILFLIKISKTDCLFFFSINTY